MQIKFRTLLLALPLFAGACSDAPDTGAEPAAQTISVTVGSAPGIDIGMQANTRTDLGPDGETIRWNSEDTIALWAVNVANPVEAAFAAHPFAMYHYNAAFNEAKFTADIPVMTAGTYDYYAVSPRPDVVAGTLATFELPAVQEFSTAETDDGYNRLPYDVLVSDPVQGPALEEGDNSDRVNLSFHHKTHLLKVVIQSNNLGERVSEVVLTFPQPVVGRLTVDAADPDAESVLTDGSETLTLRFDEPVQQGTTVYAAIAPIDLHGEEFSIVAYGETGESQVRALPGKNFAAGHTTPIIYNIPVMGRLFTRLTFGLPTDKGTATLGEEVQEITLTAPANATFDNGRNIRTFVPGADGTYTIVLKPTLQHNLSTTKVTATYESEHASVSSTLTLPQIVAYEPATSRLSVPYLFSEDFSETTTLNNNGGLGNTGHDGATVWGDDHGLAGWSGNQFYVEGGKGLAIRHQTEKYFLLGTYRGRVDSAPIRGIKKDASVKVSVSFNYNGKTNESRNTPVMHYGSTTNQDALSGYYEGGSAAVKGGDKIEHEAGTVTAPTDGSFDKIDRSIQFTIDACTNQRRLSWDCYVNDNRNFSTNQQWIFIDNVKVSIAQ